VKGQIFADGVVGVSSTPEREMPQVACDDIRTSMVAC
jgi:hypothetical protein